MFSPPSLCPLFPSTLHDCRLAPDSRVERPEDCQRHEIIVSNARPLHRNLSMPLNSLRLLPDSDHIVTQMAESPRPIFDSAIFDPGQAPCNRPPHHSTDNNGDGIAPESNPTPAHTTLRRVRHVRRINPGEFPSRIPIPARARDGVPLHGSQRRGSASTLNDTRRHGIIFTHRTMTDDTLDLPTYTPFPTVRMRTVISNGNRIAIPVETRTRTELHAELRELQRQWNQRRRSHPSSPTERTQFRPRAAVESDLPPPYAARDPYPLFKPEERRPSLISRAILYPFVPEGDLLNKAASATDRVVKELAKGMAKGMVKGVEVVGKAH